MCELYRPDLKLVEPLVADVEGHVLNDEEDHGARHIVKPPGLHQGSGQTLHRGEYIGGLF